MASDVAGKRFLRQWAVYWPPTGQVDTSGQKTFEEPEEIRCRWEDVSEAFLDRDGNEARSNAKAYVDRDLEELGVLMLGRISDLVTTDDPFGNDRDTAYEVRKFQKVPDATAKKFLRLAIM